MKQSMQKSFSLGGKYAGKIGKIQGKIKFISVQ